MVHGYPGRYSGTWYSDARNYISDDILGNAPKKNIKVSNIKYYDNKLVYDVIYTINKDGLRVSPPCVGSGCKDAILFFGCSYTFGEGLNDDETMPFLVGEHASGKVYNFGFSGYGPHQMLSAIDHGLVKKIVEGTPKYAIFQTAAFHIIRAKGDLPWDQHAPKYILAKNGIIKYAGHFDDSLIVRFRNYLLKCSSIYTNFIEWRQSNSRRRENRKDIDRYIAIVVAARDELQRRFPGLEFDIIYWNDWSGGNGTEQDREIIERFREDGIKVYLISDILPGINTYPNLFSIPLDGHPSYYANKRLANYITQNILQNHAQ